MTLKLLKRESFYLRGISVKTSLETCGSDLAKLWSVFPGQSGLYGLMWKTESSGTDYFYLLGTECSGDDLESGEGETKRIPAAEYMVAYVSAELSAFDAWTKFYNELLPSAGFSPAPGHVYDFEYYPNGDGKPYELWTPVTKN